MGVAVEIESFDELGHEITKGKGCPGIQSGGTPSGQSGGHRSPGGECFAPLLFESKPIRSLLYESL